MPLLFLFPPHPFFFVLFLSFQQLSQFAVEEEGGSQSHGLSCWLL